jgi:preprotein translocase subunit YajC
MANIILLMGQGAGSEGAFINLFFMGAIFLVMYLLIIRPQSQKQKEIQKKVEGLQKGDKVVTSGGMLGNVTSIDNDSVLVEIDSGVKARFLKSAITDVNPNKS